jgi:hypothetical protein
MTNGEQKFFDLGLWVYRNFYKHGRFDIPCEEFETYLQEHLFEECLAEEPCHPTLCHCQSDGWAFPRKCWRLREGLCEVFYDNPEF